ncbi:protein kinase domain-containing protein [Thalassoglobus sp.]|uniref:protein kinase domain-containing protein n=1 Tax=Thalassoglobus sp. TaxID=2795869 RepID=UPI003AA7C6B6
MSLTSAPIEKFLSALKESGLVEEATLNATWNQFSSQATGVTAEAFADSLVESGKITRWHASKLLKGKHKGFFLGKYKLLRLLGRGGMSSVYLAEHIVMKRQTAVKVLPYKLVADTSYLPRFYREAQAVAALDHPNIVRAYDVDHVTDGKMEIHFLVMEYVKGQNFYELIKSQGPLDPRTAADYIRQGALGLQHAHDAGMVHRDVKPGNFLVDENGIVKLMDLGLAMVNDDPEAFSVTVANEEKVLGTADYLAPEQAVDSHLVDTRADIYALGCTFYFLLAGQPPYDQGTLAQRLLAHQTKDAPPLSEYRNDVPMPLCDLINRMMIKDPEQRIQTAGEVAEELESWLAEPASAATTEFSPFVIQDLPSKPEQDSEDNGAISDFLTHLQKSGPAESPTTPTSQSSSSTSKSAKKKVVEEPKPVSPHPSDSATSVLAPDPSSIVAHRSSSQAQRKKLRKRMGVSPLFVGLVITSILAGIGVIYQLSRSPEEAAPVLSGNPPKSETVTKTPQKEITGTVIHVGPNGDFNLVSEAIRYLTIDRDKPTSIQEIRIAKGHILDDAILINNSGLGSFPSPFAITGEGPEFPVLKASDAASLVLNSVENLTISNLVIDCSNHPVGAKLSGYLSGTTLSNITFTNLSDAGIQSIGARGLSSQRLTIQDCRFEGSSDNAVGIRFSDSKTMNMSQVNVIGCEFLGPMAKGILFTNNQGVTTEVDIALSIFHKTHSGISFSGKAHQTTRFMIANNTFHYVIRGINFESGPNSASTENSIVQNLFVNVQQSEVATNVENVSLADFSGSAIPTQNNWTTGPLQNSSTWLNIFKKNGKTDAENVKFLTTDPKSPDFLKPEGNDLRLAATSAIGGRNFIGAVSP